MTGWGKIRYLLLNENFPAHSIDARNQHMRTGLPCGTVLAKALDNVCAPLRYDTEPQRYDYHSDDKNDKNQHKTSLCGHEKASLLYIEYEA